MGGLGIDPFLSTVLIYYFSKFFKFIIVYIFNPRINKVIIIIIAMCWENLKVIKNTLLDKSGNPESLKK